VLKFEAGSTDIFHTTWVGWECYTHTEGDVENLSQQNDLVKGTTRNEPW